MTHSKVELLGKCRKVVYFKVDKPHNIVEPDGSEHEEIYPAGLVMDVFSGGGAQEELTGDDLLIPPPPDLTAPEWLGCIEMFYNRIDAHAPISIDLEKVKTCCDAVDSYRTAKQAEDDFVFEKSITLLGSELPTTKVFRHALKVQELDTRNKPARTSDHDSIVQAQTDLEALCKDCDDCCEQLLVTRDDAFTFAEPIS